MAFGRFGQFPFRFGGGKRPRELAHEALLDGYRKVLDVSPDQLTDSEAFAEAAVLAMVWVAGKRAANQGQPLKMLEWLEPFEQAMQVRPAPGDSDFQRRETLAGKFIALIGNAEPDILAAATQALGVNIVGVSYLTDAEAVTYIPGINPGPPGLDWFSQRCICFVEVNSYGLTSAQYDAKVDRLKRLLDALLPAWMGFYVYRFDVEGADEGFILDVSLLDEVGLG